MADASKNPALLLGTMAMGGKADDAESEAMIEAFTPYGSMLDTAIMYQMGETEKTLGRVVKDASIPIATKVNPWFTGDGARGGLAPELVRNQLEYSLASLGRESVDLLYLHAPDHVTPIEDTLAMIDTLHKEGKFAAFGLSNYAAWEVVRIHGICSAQGYVLPTVYQGMYNCLTRHVEEELFPALRTLGMSFYAYNATAGGLLTGKYNADDDPEDGRFNKNTRWGAAYRQRFWNDTVFGAITRIGDACEAAGITTRQAALRWLAHHSCLSAEDGDAIILGGSSAAHIAQNAQDAACPDPLPDAVLQVIEQAAVEARHVCPCYFRGYSACDQ